MRVSRQLGILVSLALALGCASDPPAEKESRPLAQFLTFESPDRDPKPNFRVAIWLPGEAIAPGSKHCCAAQISLNDLQELYISVSPGGRFKVPRKWRHRVSKASVEQLIATVEKTRFFELPNRIGVVREDNEMRRIVVNRGIQFHYVALPGSTHALKDASDRERYRRAMKVWNELHRYIRPIPMR